MNEIKKIAKILDEAECVEDALFVDFDGMAKALVNAGYGDTKQAVREFAEKLKTVFEMNYWGSTHKVVFKEINKLLAEVIGE